MKHLVIPLLLLTAACTSPAELRQQDQFACVDYGFEPGSQGMATCLQSRDENRHNRTAAALTDMGDSLQAQGQFMILNSQLQMLNARAPR